MAGNPDPVRIELGPGPGRPKGSKNKFPTAIKDKVLHACAALEAEGKDLTSLALNKPEWFWEVFVKPMLPKDLSLRIVQSWQDLTEEEKAKLLAEAEQMALERSTVPQAELIEAKIEDVSGK